MHAIRRHYAKKEALEHMQAQNALACGDLKSFHRHEARAHRAGSHAHSGSMMQTDLLMAKENMPPVVVASEPIPAVIATRSQPTLSAFLQPLPPMPGPIEIDETPMPANTIVEAGEEMSPTVVVEPIVIEEARTIVEWNMDPIAPIMMVEQMGMTPAMVGMEEVVQYGEPRFVRETITTAV